MLAAKSSISCVSAMPPIAEPEKLRRPKTVTGNGLSGAPPMMLFPRSHGAHGTAARFS